MITFLEGIPVVCYLTLSPMAVRYPYRYYTETLDNARARPIQANANKPKVEGMSVITFFGDIPVESYLTPSPMAVRRPYRYQTET